MATLPFYVLSQIIRKVCGRVIRRKTKKLEVTRNDIRGCNNSCNLVGRGGSEIDQLLPKDGLGSETVEDGRENDDGTRMGYVEL